ncbi:hypothetical protein K1T71_008605 [Dendrolimus kikuchii]|uniref:Uncharacterized protein n=1 Tax=Dendrolimus kikuchii TaxID=765133 RepID=A0ACC1CV46_9NEOP|nr:hypothetical protein K1T71_008605 [Dendrolimus kikuchii]
MKLRKKWISQVSIRSTKSEIQADKDNIIPPLDTITVKVLSLRLNDNEPKHFAIKITFSDQLILSGILKSIGRHDVDRQHVLVSGSMSYDPSDYERMCLLADCPLVVNIQPLKNVEANSAVWSRNNLIRSSSNKSNPTVKTVSDVSCCNVDILPMFIDKNTMCVRKRMEPMYKQSILHKKSWDNLPLLTMELVVSRNPLNAKHHEVLKEANYMKLTLVGMYNTIIPFEDDFVYTAASKMPLNNETNVGLVIFNQGGRATRRFRSTCFYPKWETLRLGDEIFSRDDVKFTCQLSDLQNEDCIDLDHYENRLPSYYKTIWRSFHRTLMLGNSSQWFLKQVKRYKWPLEVHIYGENGGYSFMSYMDLSKLLYPGEYVIRMAVPLHWINSDMMMEKCGCELLLTPNDRPPTTAVATRNTTTDAGIAVRSTGSDDNNAYAIVEIKLAKPLKKIVIPPYISQAEINNMLKSMEQCQQKRDCTGRGQLNRDWHTTARGAASSLRRVPYYGMIEFCAFNRQLSETRTRVELLTSFWQDAAIFVNNNFVVQEYLESGDKFEELLMMSHVCLMRETCVSLTGADDRQTLDPILRAARHARHMQDTNHAMDLYLQLVAQKQNDAACWRELAICMRDIDKEWANVCVNKSIALDPRHHLTLLLKGSMLFEDDPVAAEQFFVALLALHPFWPTGWIITSVYYANREIFHMADKINECIKKCRAEGVVKDYSVVRSWEQELGDWWDHTPLLPGMSKYYDAADLLLRIRSIPLAEICLAHALKEVGETAAYFHLLALCFRLRGQADEALCHIRLGIEKFGEISYLRSLEAECYHKKNDCKAAMTSFEKSGNCVGAYSILLSMPSREPLRVISILVDLVRRQPSAYAWMTLADDWMAKAAVGEGGDAGLTEEQASARTCAIACAVQALKWDRLAGRAWAMLANLVRPTARRLHCIDMATYCGLEPPEGKAESSAKSEQSLCHYLGTALKECQCKQNLKF